MSPTFSFIATRQLRTLLALKLTNQNGAYPCEAGLISTQFCVFARYDSIKGYIAELTLIEFLLYKYTNIYEILRNHICNKEQGHFRANRAGSHECTLE